MVKNPTLITDSNIPGQQVNSGSGHLVKTESSLVLEASETMSNSNETFGLPAERVVPPCDIVNVIHVIPGTVDGGNRALNDPSNLIIVANETMHGIASETLGEVIGNAECKSMSLPESCSSVSSMELQINSEPDGECKVEKSIFDLNCESASDNPQATGESDVAESADSDNSLLSQEVNVQVDKVFVSRQTEENLNVRVGLVEIEVNDLLHPLPSAGREAKQDVDKDMADQQKKVTSRPSAFKQSAKHLAKQITQQSAKQSFKQSAKQLFKQSESSLGIGRKTAKQRAVSSLNQIGNKRSPGQKALRSRGRPQQPDKVVTTGVCPKAESIPPKRPSRSNKTCKKESSRRTTRRQSCDRPSKLDKTGSKKKKQRPSPECLSQFKGIKSNQNPDGTHKCNQCDEIFEQPRHLVSHKRLHHDKQSFSCDQCGKTFARRHLLLEHKRIHEGKGQFICTECDKAFIDNWHLQKHKLSHSEERPFVCDECPQAFKCKFGLKAHKDGHSGASRAFQCELCGQRFLRKGHLQDHQRIHTGEKPFKCEVCDCRFSKKNHLTSHKHIHSDEKPFECEICAKTFGVQRNLTVHMRVHTGERPYKCDFDLCTKAFMSSSDLKRHKRSHTGERPYGCDRCGQTFRQSSRIKQHKCPGVLKQEEAVNLINRPLLLD